MATDSPSRSKSRAAWKHLSLLGDCQQPLAGTKKRRKTRDGGPSWDLGLPFQGILVYTGVPQGLELRPVERTFSSARGGTK